MVLNVHHFQRIPTTPYKLIEEITVESFLFFGTYLIIVPSKEKVNHDSNRLFKRRYFI
ncbi:MAG: hypothetical protein BSOLF_0472 [Candidatus Carbobacillus altaicus]|uniref:Uncharacterized protein n=1 Tax=Candidatus Carbonibacillus altaicus TaxID=2163959 RepID=A0A2R6Y0Y0_9BACL|nr:MAG: hypothetical protein BSOLF_0472 [Candidatus Carbobacillus altaicus]